jgi:hypothetical protein
VAHLGAGLEIKAMNAALQPVLDRGLSVLLAPQKQDREQRQSCGEISSVGMMKSFVHSTAIKKENQPSVIVHTHNPRTWEAEAGDEFWVSLNI